MRLLWIVGLTCALAASLSAQQRGGQGGQGRGQTAQGQAQAQTPSNLKPGSVSGQVVNDQTTQAIRKASVRLTKSGGGGQQAGFAAGGGQTGYETQTDAGGNFTFPSVEPGRYTISAQRTGFISSAAGAGGGGAAAAVIQAAGGAAPGGRGGGGRGGAVVNAIAGANSNTRRIDVTEAQRVSGVVVKLVPQAAISGRIADEDDDPLQAANVQLFRYRFIAGRKQLTTVGTGRTNDLGEYRISGVNAGRYYLSVSASGGGAGGGLLDAILGGGGRGGGRGGNLTRVNMDVNQAYAPTFYPGVADATSAIQIDLKPGSDMRGMDLRLRKTPVVTVRGTVQGLAIADATVQAPQAQNGGRGGRGGPGGPGGGPPAVVQLVPTGGGQALGENLVGQVSRTGTFEVRNVRPGSYTLLASQGGRGGQAMSGRTSINVGQGDLEGVSVLLNPSFNLNGVISTGDAKPDNLNNVIVQFIPIEDVIGSPMVGRMQADKKFTVQVAEPSRFHIVATNLPTDYYLKSARYGTAEVLDTGLDLTSGVAAGELDLRIAPGAATVSGVVTADGGAPAAGATVAIIPEEPYNTWWELYRTTSTDQSGNFQFTGLRPSRYRVYAFEKLDAGAHQDPEFMRRFETSGKSVKLNEKSAETIQLKAVPEEESVQ